MVRQHRLVLAIVLAALGSGTAFAQQMDPNSFNGMRWRLIGPFRGGRASAVTGAPSQPGVYYMGAAQGGVWKTNDGGQTWRPIFDQERVASIGAIAVAESNPDVIYVGTGESTPGQGIYKTTDAGATWTNIGLRDTHFISAVLVDPRNPEIVLAAAAGDRAPGSARGVYKSADGGRTWSHVLYKDEMHGARDMCFAPDDARIVYATLSRGFFAPPVANASDQVTGIYRSSDEGATWERVAGQGLPEDSRSIGISVAPGTQGRRLYAILSEGLFRSDDAGATWQRSSSDPRLPTFGKVLVDPRNANVVYVPQTSLYRSTDGGKTFESFMGAPSGDDIRLIWVNPQNSQHIILGVDQGAVISMNGGQTWSSWYNQPTGQFYHVSTDNDFPYRVLAAQQDSGTAAVASRSDYGEITERDWAPVGGFEYGYIVADPLDPNIVYNEGWYSTVIRFDRRTGSYAYVFMPGSKYRAASMLPLIFSPQDPHTLYLGTQYVLKTTDGGMSWSEISPDLTQGAQPPAPAGPTAGRGRAPGGAITTLAPSTQQGGVIWAGTTNGQIQVTRDGGKSWQNVSAGLPSPTSITLLEASRHDASTAYAAVGVPLDPRPYFYRTRDGGRTWQKISEGISDNGIARVVREDPARKGLLYAGTETSAYVSFDDGDHWQSLQLNLPTTSVRDLEIHGDDLVAATYGRALWILDDVTPLRQADPRITSESAHFFRPQTALRWRWNQNQDTPLPPEYPAGENPPDGAILDYYLKSPARELTLEFFDRQGHLVRRYSSVPPPPPTILANVPSYWFAPPDVLPTTPGMHRFVWDLRYPTPLALPYSYYGNILEYTEYTLADHAIPGKTPRQQPPGPLVVPGEYKAVLTVDGKRLESQTLMVKLDPRLHVSPADLAEQLDLELKINAGMDASYAAFERLRELRVALAERRKSLAANSQAGEALSGVTALDQKLATLEDGTRAEPGIGPANRDLTRLALMVQSADIRPPETARAAVAESCQALNKNLALWRQVNAGDLPALNSLLQKYGLAALPVAKDIPADMPCGK